MKNHVFIPVFVFWALLALFVAACAPPVGDDTEHANGTEDSEDKGTPQAAETPEITGQVQEGYTAAPGSAAASLAVTVTAPSDGGTLTYQWYKAESETAEGQAIAGAAGRRYTPPLNADGTAFYYVVVTNTADGKTAAVTSARAKIVVDPGLAAYTAGQFGGEENTADSQSITFTFSKAIDDLEADDITVADGSGSIVKGAVMGTPNSANRALFITVNKAGTVRVSIAKAGVESVPKDVTVFKAAGGPAPPEEDDEEEPEGPPGLAGTAWAWSGVKLTFRESAVTMTGVAKSYPYTFDGEERTGNIDTLGNFTVDQDFLRLTFENFNNLGGDPKVFDNLSAALTGTSWRFGRALLTFPSGAKARLHGFDYAYTYDSATKTGAITAKYGQPGPFTLSPEETTLTFSNYRDSKHEGSAIPVVFTKVTGTDQPPGGASLIGSDWWWTGTSLHLDFITDTVVLLWSFTGYYVPPILFDYTHSAAEGTGRIFNGRNDVGTKYDLGDYTISGDLLNFVQYGPYPHGAAFFLQE
ncbi:MAG: hypothetical protein LBD96_03005 [Treponema sp.]|jgi:hypothetical protein|nr:hypothetical protein [Treponema sp.]